MKILQKEDTDLLYCYFNNLINDKMTFSEYDDTYTTKNNESPHPSGWGDSFI